MGDPPCTLAGRVVQETPWYQSVVDTFWSVLNAVAFLYAPQQLVVLSDLLSLVQVRCCLHNTGQEPVCVSCGQMRPHSCLPRRKGFGGFWKRGCLSCTALVFSADLQGLFCSKASVMMHKYTDRT